MNSRAPWWRSHRADLVWAAIGLATVVGAAVFRRPEEYVIGVIVLAVVLGVVLSRSRPFRLTLGCGITAVAIALGILTPIASVRLITNRDMTWTLDDAKPSTSSEVNGRTYFTGKNGLDVVDSESGTPLWSRDATEIGIGADGAVLSPRMSRSTLRPGRRNGPARTFQPAASLSRATAT